MDLSVERLKVSDAEGGGGGDGDEDRLSALPDDVLIHILVLVYDAAAAARTSILARRWRRCRLWTLLPELSFDFIEHHRIRAALAAHEAPDLTLLVAFTEDASPESLSAWLPIAARALSGPMHLEIDRREDQIEAEQRGAIDLPCFEKSTSIMLKLGFLGLTLPPSGVSARLNNVWLEGIKLHGQSDLGDLLSSQRCPSLEHLRIRDIQDLDIFNIQSDSLLHVELLSLHSLQQLTVMAPALKSFKMNCCFTDPLDPDLSVANISAPQLRTLNWMNTDDPSSVQLAKMTHLEWLGIQLYIREEEGEAVQNTPYCMKLLRRFEHVHSVDIMIIYPREKCTRPYLIEPMPRLPDVSLLLLGVVAYGHSFGASTFDVLRSCTGVKKLDLDFVPEIQLEEQTPCPSGCVYDQPANWRTEELVLNCLEEIEVHGLRGAELEVALVQRLFHWATALKMMKIVFHESVTRSKGIELGQLLLSFSRPGISMDFSIFVP